MKDYEIRHLRTKIRMFEDMLLRSKHNQEIELLDKEIRKMRLELLRAGGGLT